MSFGYRCTDCLRASERFGKIFEVFWSARPSFSEQQSFNVGVLALVLPPDEAIALAETAAAPGASSFFTAAMPITGQTWI